MASNNRRRTTLADLGFVVRQQILGDAADHLRDAVLPRQVEVGHLDLAARQADDRGPVGGPGHRDGQVLDEGVERIGHPPVAVHEVEHLVEQHQHRRARRREHPPEGVGARRRPPRVRAEQRRALVARELPGDVDPRRFASLPRVPGVADEHRHPGRGRGRQPRLVQQRRDVVQVRDPFAGRHQVIERGQRVGLPPAELRHQRHHRRRVRRLPGQSPQHHPGVSAQRAGEAGAGEERLRVAVVGRRRPADHLLQGDGELVRIERTAFADLLAGERDLVPGL